MRRVIYEFESDEMRLTVTAPSAKTDIIVEAEFVPYGTILTLQTRNARELLDALRTALNED